MPNACATGSAARSITMTTPELPATPDITASVADAERRLHPMSWLFVLLQQLRQFIAPLIALLVFGRRNDDGDAWWPLIGVGVLVLLSLWRYFTYRYGVLDDRLVIRSGLLERSLRVIPFARIHNVALKQSVLHRVFGVAEVRLESAGGNKPEAEMRVLKLADALALESLVRQRAHSGTAATQAAPVEATTLLQLSLAEVLRLGVVSNRGMIVVGAGMAGLWQFGGDKFGARVQPQISGWLKGLLNELFGYAGSHGYGPVDYALTGASVILLTLVLLRLLSVLLALLQHYGFTLTEHGRRLTVERGLLARWRTAASRRRIQAWTLHEGLLHRWLRRRTLLVDTAAAEQEGEPRALHEIAPIATPETCDRLIEHLLPRGGWSQLQWQPLERRHWWRLWLPDVPATLLACAVLGWHFGAWGLIALSWLPWSAFKARRRIARAGYAVSEHMIAVREGWVTRYWRFAELDKLQALQLVLTPLDRRCGTATLWLDTTGAGMHSEPLRIRFLPVATARALHDTLARTLARRPLRW